MKNKNQIRRAAILSYAMIFFNILAGLLYTPWMVSQIGQGDYGLYILVTTFLAYFVVDYGMWQSINKLISQYRAGDNQKKIEQTIGVAMKIYLIFDIIVCLVLFSVYFFIDTIFDNLTPGELLKFKRVFLIAAFFSVLNFPFGFVRGVMYAYEYLVQSNYFELGAKILLIIATVTVLILGGGLYWLVLVYAFVPLVKNIWSVYFLYRQGVRMDIRFWRKETIMSIFGIYSWLFLYVIAELFINNISPTIISIRGTLEHVSIFAIGITIYGYVYQICNSISGLFLPKISKMKHFGQDKEIGDFAIKIARIQLIISGFVIFGIIVSGSQFIDAWMGDAFVNSYYVVLFTVLPGLIIYSQQIEQTKLFATGKIYYRTIAMILTAISSVSISYILVPTYGAIGAAIAISISNFVFMAIGMNIVYQKVLNFDGKKFYLLVGKFVGVFILVAFCVLLFQYFVYEPYFVISNKWLNFFVIGGVYTLLYCILVYVLLLNKYEKGLIQSVIRLIINKTK